MEKGRRRPSVLARDSARLMADLDDYSKAKPGPPMGPETLKIDRRPGVFPIDDSSVRPLGGCQRQDGHLPSQTAKSRKDEVQEEGDLPPECRNQDTENTIKRGFVITGSPIDDEDCMEELAFLEGSAALVEKERNRRRLWPKDLVDEPIQP